MNVTMEHLAPCKKLLRVEVDKPEVDAAFESITKEFAKRARLPGFRPGKAPVHLVIKAFGGRIEEEVRRKLVSDKFHKALEEQHLEVAGQTELEVIKFARGEPFQFAVTVETAPDFELPEYKGLPVKREVRAVTEEDVERALDLLRDQRATFVDVERPVQAGDFAVVDYQGSCEGKPITELAPTARGLTEKKGFWLQIEPEAFIPGFSDQLLGAQAGEQRTVQVTFPADFVTPQLAGKAGQFEVTLTQVKEKVFPELDEKFAQALGAEDTNALREGVRRDLENELQYSLKRSTREQIVRELLRRVQCDLPESVVAKETKTVVYDIVRENTERGITRETIDQQKDQIFSYASSSARDRVKTSFILERIAGKEGLKAEPNEVGNRIVAIAQQNGIKPEQLVKQLKDRGGLEEIREQVVAQKALEFLEQHAVFEDVLPGGGTPV